MAENENENETMVRGPETIAKAPEPEVESKSEAEWYYAEGIPGEGEKPEWFNDKTYKTIMDQAKAGNELRKMLGEQKKAPEEYSLDLSEERYKDFKFNQEDPLFKFWKDFAKENKLPQEMFSKGLTTWVDYIKGIEKERGDNFKKSIESLGAGFDQTLEQIQNWFSNNFPEHSFDNFKMLLQSPEDIKLILAMKDKMQKSTISTQDMQSAVTMDRDYWRKQMSRENGYGIDQRKTAAVNAAFKKFIEQGGKA